MHDLNIVTDSVTQAKEQDLGSFIFPLFLQSLNAMRVENLNSFSAVLYVWAGFFVDQLKKTWDSVLAVQYHFTFYYGSNTLKYFLSNFLPQLLFLMTLHFIKTYSDQKGLVSKGMDYKLCIALMDTSILK